MASDEQAAEEGWQSCAADQTGWRECGNGAGWAPGPPHFSMRVPPWRAQGGPSAPPAPPKRAQSLLGPADRLRTAAEWWRLGSAQCRLSGALAGQLGRGIAAWQPHAWLELDGARPGWAAVPPAPAPPRSAAPLHGPVAVEDGHGHDNAAVSTALAWRGAAWAGAVVAAAACRAAPTTAGLGCVTACCCALHALMPAPCPLLPAVQQQQQRPLRHAGAGGGPPRPAAAAALCGDRKVQPHRQG